MALGCPGTYPHPKNLGFGRVRAPVRSRVRTHPPRILSRPKPGLHGTLVVAVCPIPGIYAGGNVATPYCGPVNYVPYCAANLPYSTETYCGMPVISQSAGSITVMRQANPVNDLYTNPAPVILDANGYAALSDSANAFAAGGAPDTGTSTTAIMAVIPPQAGVSAVPVPPQAGTTTTSNLSGLVLRDAQRRGASRRSQLSGLSISSGAAGSLTAGILSVTGAFASYGTMAGPIGSLVGACVGVVVGVIEGLFGHKKVIPTVSNADIAQAQQWYGQYIALAGSVVGRTYTEDFIHDMLTAEAILDPGFWGDTKSNQITIPAVQNFYGEVMQRLTDFFSALMASNVGDTIVLVDDPSIIGHCATNLHVKFEFISPGANAPSYILGPIFAQYFFTMCTIYLPAADCVGHLNPPVPQLYTDVLDFFRAGTAYDTPQPNVVTGTDVGVAAPTKVAVCTPISWASSVQCQVYIDTAPDETACQAEQIVTNPESYCAPGTSAPVVVSTNAPECAAQYTKAVESGVTDNALCTAQYETPCGQLAPVVAQENQSLLLWGLAIGGALLLLNAQKNR